MSRSDTLYRRVTKGIEMAFSGLSISSSGLRVARTSLNTSANNIANLSTKGFKSREVNSQSLPSGGVEAILRQNDNPGSPFIDPFTGEFAESSNTDIIKEFVNMIVAGNLAVANGRAITAHDEILGLSVNLVS